MMSCKRIRLVVKDSADGGEVLAVMNGRQALRLVLMERNVRYVPVRE